MASKIHETYIVTELVNRYVLISMVAERNVCYVVWSLDHRVDIIIEHVDMSSVKRSYIVYVAESPRVPTQGLTTLG